MHFSKTCLNVVTYNAWGMVTTSHKDDRITALSHQIRSGTIGVDKDAFDIILLQEVWRKEDHDEIRANLPSGYHMTGFYQLAHHKCHYALVIEDCSGLAIISRFPFLSIEFNGYHCRGGVLDGEGFVRKGVGRVRLNPIGNISVDVFVTHTIAEQASWVPKLVYDNDECRVDQVTQLMNFYVTKSDADVIILGGDLNNPPATNPGSPIQIVMSHGVLNVGEAVLGNSEWLDPQYATFGNGRNTFSGHKNAPTILDYLFCESNADGATVKPIKYKLPLLTIDNSHFKNKMPYLNGHINTKNEMSTRTSSPINSIMKKKAQQRNNYWSRISLSDHEPVWAMICIAKANI